MFKNINNTIDSYFDNKEYDNPTELCYLFNKYKSDKANHHNYSTFYNYIFSHIKNDSLNLFEVGLGTNNVSVPSNMGSNGNPGASLFAWKEYFQNFMIYGADVDEGCLFQEDRIKTFYIDQTNPEVINSSLKSQGIKNSFFDIIIDDGLHQYEANRTLFENSISKLKKGGIYIIEDISSVYLQNIEKWFEELVNCKKYFYVEIVTIPINTEVQENNILGVIVK